MVGVTRRLRRLESHLAPSTAEPHRQQGAAPVGSAGGSEPAARRPFELEDMFRTKSVGGARLSPCGKWLAYTVTTTDRVADSSETALWMASTEGDGSTAPVRMTAKGTSAGSPRWSPDGSMLTFLSSRADPGSDAPDTTQKLTAVENGVNSFEWSPDAARPRLLLSVRDDLTPKPPPTNDDEPTPPVAEPWVIDKLEFKQDYVGYLDQTRGGVHLWVQEPAVPDEDAPPQLTQITSGSSDEWAGAWSPCGRLVAFSSNRTAEPAANTTSNIFVVHSDNTDKGRTLVRVTAAEGSGDSEPAWSPDGKAIAYVTCPGADAALLSGSGFATPHLAVAPADGSGASSVTVLTKELDRNVSDPFWSEDGKRILFRVEDSGRVELVSIDPQGNGLERVLQGGYAVGAVHAAGGLAATVISNPHAPGEVHLLDTWDGGSLRKLTSVNDAWLSELQLGSVTKHSFLCKDTREYTHVGHRPIKLDTVNDEVEMFVHAPVGFEGTVGAGLKRPTLLWIHGGPVGQYDYSFQQEQHLFAAAGYVVLSVNPRGSSGRGQAFCQALFADWGGPALKDVLTAVDYAVGQDKGVAPLADGGMLTNHIIVTDHRLYQLLWEQELGLPWETPETWEAISPFNNVGSAQTPTLIMCGEKDWNVPVQNSDQLYQALKRLGVATSLVVYPDSGHWVGAPSEEADAYQRWLDWFARFNP